MTLILLLFIFVEKIEEKMRVSIIGLKVKRVYLVKKPEVLSQALKTAKTAAPVRRRPKLLSTGRADRGGSNLSKLLYT